MFLLLLILIQAQAEPRAEPAPADIVVLGERLKAMRFSGGVDKRGVIQCKIKRSSGDPALDALPCKAIRACAARGLETKAAVQGCMQEQLGAYIKALSTPATP